jgi:hypothetical protein
MKLLSEVVVYFDYKGALNEETFCNFDFLDGYSHGSRDGNCVYPRSNTQNMHNLPRRPYNLPLRRFKGSPSTPLSTSTIAAPRAFKSVISHCGKICTLSTRRHPCSTPFDIFNLLK